MLEIDDEELRHVATKLDALLDADADGTYTYYIPAAVALDVCWSSPVHSSAAGVCICRQILKRLLRGESQQVIEQYLKVKLEYDDERCLKSVFILTLECAAAAADVLDGEITQQEAVTKLLRIKNSDENTILAMLEMILKLHNEDKETYTIDRIRHVRYSPHPAGCLRRSCLITPALIAAWVVFCVAFQRPWGTFAYEIFGALFVYNGFEFIKNILGARSARIKGRVFSG